MIYIYTVAFISKKAKYSIVKKTTDNFVLQTPDIQHFVNVLV